MKSPAGRALRLHCLPFYSPLPIQPSSLFLLCPSKAPAEPTFSIRPVFSAELSSSLCSLSLSLCSLAFSLSTVSIWASWALPEVAWVLPGPSTPGGLREPSGPWPRAAGCEGGRCSWGCCRYWYCCCWRNTGGIWACRILGTEETVLRDCTESPMAPTLERPEAALPSQAYWKDKSTQPPYSGKGLCHMLSA